MKSRVVKPKEKPKTKAKEVIARRKIKRPVVEKKEQLVFGLHRLQVPFGAHKEKKILGRGPSSGHGKTSSRGSKGQTSRSGRHSYLGFEGGQSPLIRKIPKHGFVHASKKEYQLVHLNDLNKIKESLVDLELLAAKGMIKDKNKLVKILSDGEIKNPITVKVHAVSKKAAEKIKNAGGAVEILK